MFKKHLLILFLVTSVTASSGQINLAGRYETSFETLELKCDSSFIMIAIPYNDTITFFGRWFFGQNKLKLSFDSSSPQRYTEQMASITLNMRNGFLYPPKITRAEYRKLKHAAKKEYHPRKEKPYFEYKKGNIEKLEKVAPIQCA